MPFISFSFAMFFVVVASLYHFAPRLGKNALYAQQGLLLAASLVFYAFADLRFVPFLLYVVAVSYYAGLFARNRVSLALFVIADMLPLLFFKYSRTHWIFPLGLSFFTFQSIAYIADVYKKKMAAEKNPLMVALFIGFFPTVASGPIQRAGSLIPQLKSVHRFDYDDATDGMRLFAWGMFKKLVIADRIAVYVDYVYGNVSDSHGLALLLATALYSFQIYCDFSGYSDMAIGVARYFGFDVGRNFDHPYLSQSVGEFWRRWHISLSSWLRDYVYIPLGGSRVALPRIYLNLMITFLVSGVWHGSSWHFVAWGLIHGAYLCVERAAAPFLKKLNVSMGFKIVITFCLVTFAWIFFRAEGFLNALKIIRKMMRIPSELLAFGDMQRSLGMKNAVRTLLALPAIGGFKGMAKTLALLAVLVGIEFATRFKSGLSILKSMKSDIRWLVYALCIIALVKVLPLNLLFEEKHGYSTNFIYQNF